jgi:hypothetical protein
VRIAANEYGRWLSDPELVRLRHEWIRAFQEWDRLADIPSDAILSDEQRTKLRRYHTAETAYFARCRALTAD